MTKVLVVFATSEGQSRKIAEAIAEELRRNNVQAEVADSTAVPALGRYPGFDGIVAGAPVHAGRFPRRFVRWARRNAGELSNRPSAFYSVCLGILQPEAAVQAQERKIVGEFFRATGWRPAHWRIFAGALAYTRLGFFTKRILRWIARKNGGGTDLSRDYEYTDWHDVRRFAAAFAEHVKAHPHFGLPGVGSSIA